MTKPAIPKGVAGLLMTLFEIVLYTFIIHPIKND